MVMSFRLTYNCSFSDSLVAKSRDNLDVFRFELCSYPPALFSGMQFLKPVLAGLFCLIKLFNCLWILSMLDGRALLQRIPWRKGATFEICTVYTEYVTRKYKDAMVVFHGYQSKIHKGHHSPETNQRARRSYCNLHGEYASRSITMRKDQFLANKENKQRFINMFSTMLVQKNCKMYHASGDADLLIVQKAVESASTVDTVLIGDDTDLLILLIYHASLDLATCF